MTQLIILYVILNLPQIKKIKMKGLGAKMAIDREFGHIVIKLQEVIEKREISKSQLSYKSEVTRSQINKLCKGEVVRADFNTLARLCCVLDCRIEDILCYIPSDKNTPTV